MSTCVLSPFASILQLFLSLKTHSSFKSFLERIQQHPACNNMTLESLLLAPLKRIESYILDLQELRSHTPPQHVDYKIILDTVTELEIIQKVTLIFLLLPKLTDSLCMVYQWWVYILPGHHGYRETKAVGQKCSSWDDNYMWFWASDVLDFLEQVIAS